MDDCASSRTSDRERPPATSSSDPGPRRGAAVLWLVAALLIATAIGAWQLRFLCDDAYITFRYVANAHDGLGLVWNAPPFRPVEGYTGFLWALLLWAVWSWFGVEPPAAANVLSLGFGLATFGVAACAALRLRGRDGAQLPAVVGLTALGVMACNRTFLQWMTGGLETALFNLGFVAWVLHAFRAGAVPGTRWLSVWSTAAAVTALTRPDGLLLVAVTGATAFVLVLRRRLSPARAACGLAPLLVIAAHVAWRRGFYGDWLPNTYYAKVTAPWPEAGWRYAFCFAFEHGAWVWPLVAAAALVTAVARCRGVAAAARWCDERLPALAAVAAAVFHVAFYLVRVGADHFEYRVLSHTVPLGTLATAALAAHLRRGALLPVGAMVLTALASSVGWCQYWLTEPRLYPQYDPLCDKVPAWLRPVVREYDRQQLWLQLQFCFRTPVLAIWVDKQQKALPERARMATDPQDIPVVQTIAAGYLAWVLPDIAVVDELGLNDWVGARTPTTEWYFSFLPRERWIEVLDRTDPDHDGRHTRDEFAAALAAVAGAPPAAMLEFVDRWLLLFGGRFEDALADAEVEELRAFHDRMRFIAHERRVPAEYLAALDPNVTIVDRRVVVRPRPVPLTAERVRQIEDEWRRRLGG
ncbi:MAG: hypothetical protein JNL08_02790 [Planctomycetes bacterium]|nr:hypothetical protein [Planctomycetota bacterium]